MKRSLHLWSRAGTVAFAGLAIAATAAFAYERPDTKPYAALLVAEQDADPGIDFMITGPAGPGKAPVLRSEAAASGQTDRPLRRRMHLK